MTARPQGFSLFGGRHIEKGRFVLQATVRQERQNETGSLSTMTFCDKDGKVTAQRETVQTRQENELL